MLLGVDDFPIQQPPQILHEVGRKLEPLLAWEAEKAELPMVESEHWTVENAACCSSKVVDEGVGRKGHICAINSAWRQHDMN